jgi:hypothetical protein
MKTWIKNAVKALLRDLDDRAGLSLDQVDADVRREIREAWRGIIQAAYDTRPYEERKERRPS